MLRGLVRVCSLFAQCDMYSHALQHTVRAPNAFRRSFALIVASKRAPVALPPAAACACPTLPRLATQDTKTTALEEACVSFIEEHAESVVTTEAWARALTEEALCSLLQSDQLKVREASLFHAVAWWGQAALTESRAVMALREAERERKVAALASAHGLGALTDEEHEEALQALRTTHSSLEEVHKKTPV